MSRRAYVELEDCNYLAVRQAARHITQFYDQWLAPGGLRTTQFSILENLRRLGPMTINALAAEMVMDRTTLGRNRPAARARSSDRIVPGQRDRRIKELQLAEEGAQRLRCAFKGWTKAQARFVRTPRQSTAVR